MECMLVNRIHQNFVKNFNKSGCDRHLCTLKPLWGVAPRVLNIRNE